MGWEACDGQFWCWATRIVKDAVYTQTIHTKLHINVYALLHTKKNNQWGLYTLLAGAYMRSFELGLQVVMHNPV